MGILGINNRTENWKTARYFAPFFESASARAALANRLLEPFGECESGTVKMELYWKGMRDYIHQLNKKNEPAPQNLRERYIDLFPDLRECIGKFEGLRQPEPFNYDGSPENKKRLYNNLKNTEIDIILQTPRHLFIGEAKDQSGFGADGSLILVHQLIRQYVMASILVDCLGSEKKVVPFIVGNPERIKRSAQVEFMIRQRWLDETNILSWDCIKRIRAKAEL